MVTRATTKAFQWFLGRTRGDMVIWVCVLALSFVGLLAVYSSIGTLAYRSKGGNTEFYLLKQLIFIGLGLFLMYLCHLIDYRYYSRIGQVLLWITPALLLYTLLFGTEINDARRWITLPGLGFTIQTSDLAKLALIMYIARYLAMKQEEITSFKGSFLPILGWITVTCALIAPANLSTALVLFATSLIILFIGRIPLLHLLLVVGSVVVAVLIIGFLVMKAPDEQISKIARLKTWKSRIENFSKAREATSGGQVLMDDASYQVVQAKIAIAGSGIIGRGPGNSVQRNFLPSPYADFIYAIIIEEYGLLGGLFVISLYLILMFRCLRIVVRTPKAFGALLAVGLAFSLVLQAFINMGVAVNLFPVTGLALPLISMGGSSMIFTSIALGIILSVSRVTEEGEPKEADTKAN